MTAKTASNFYINEAELAKPLAVTTHKCSTYLLFLFFHCLNEIHPPKWLQGQNTNLRSNFVHGNNFWFTNRDQISQISLELLICYFHFFKMASFVYLFWRRAGLSWSKLKSRVWLSALFLLAAQLNRPADKWLGWVLSVFKKKQKSVSCRHFKTSQSGQGKSPYVGITFLVSI